MHFASFSNHPRQRSSSGIGHPQPAATSNKSVDDAFFGETEWVIQTRAPVLGAVASRGLRSIGSSVAGLFRRKRQQPPVQHDGSIRDDDDDIAIMDERIRKDFCEIEDSFGSLAWEQCVDSSLAGQMPRRLHRSKRCQTRQSSYERYHELFSITNCERYT